MTSEEIKEMFLANAKLRHMSFINPERHAFEEKLQSLTKQYVDECLEDMHISSEPEPKHMSNEEAVQIIIGACNNASMLELACNQKPEDEPKIKQVTILRKMAIEHIVSQLLPVELTKD